MRIAIGGIRHESNTFNPARTDRAAFTVQTGEEILSVWKEAHHEIGGMIGGAEALSCELLPTLVASATPSGPVAADVLDWWTHEILSRLAGTGTSPPLDGLLLALHGAMVVEGYPDGDGEVVRRLRARLGPEFPIVVTHDYHANISERIVADSTALLVYKTCPHVDQRQIGLEAARLMARVVRGEVRPAQALAKPPLLLNICFHNTSLEPMKSILDAARAGEQQPGVLSASVAAGYQYADVPEMGPSALVVTDDDPETARREADRLADRIWAAREQMVVELPDAAEAVQRALDASRESSRPVVLVDMGDNIGGGSAGDGTIILAELLRRDAGGWVVALADPEAVQACIEAGVGAAVHLRVGGRTDELHGTPVDLCGWVRCLHDGRYVEHEPRHGGARFHDQGRTAVVGVGGAQREPRGNLVLTSRREPPFSLQQLVSLGLSPERQKILVVKAAVAFRAAYEPVCGRIIEVDTPGLTAVNPERFTYRHVGRTLWGMNA